MTRSVNIRGVATQAGVSTATVSRYLNGKKVSPAAEQRIGAAIQDLSYSPNLLARSLKLKKTMTVGMVIPDITNPFFPAVVKGVEDTARHAGFTFMLFNAGEDEEREAECVGALQAQRCDGALLIIAPKGPRHVQHRQELQKLTLPVVYIDRAPNFDADVVMTDNVLSATDAVRHLIRLGHTRIAAVSVTLDVSVHHDRIEGYRRALKEANLPRVPELEVSTLPTVPDGFSVVSQLLALPDRPSAIFVTSSRLTIGTMAAIEGHGLECPRDLSVVGYDNYDWQDVFHPRMTTVAQPAYLMGTRAAELLLARIQDGKGGPRQRIILPSTLVVRESCGVYNSRPVALRAASSASRP